MHSFMELSKCSVLNAADSDVLTNVLQGTAQGDAIIKSDCDEQLLFSIVFRQTVRLQSIGFAAPSAAPKTVKIFVNKGAYSPPPASRLRPAPPRPLRGRLSCARLPPAARIDNMSFDDVEMPATQTLTVTGAAQIPLQFVKFQSVTSVTVFVEDNQDDDEVRAPTPRGAALRSLRLG